jgi:hypothetical protein
MGPLDEDSATMSVDTSGAVLALKLLNTHVIAHMTKGFSILGDADNYGAAVNFKGSVATRFGSKAEAATWEIGFIQLHRINRLAFYYAGAKRPDGAITIDATGMPALSTTLALDSENDFTPWTHADPFFMVGRRATNFSTDHPSSKAGYERKNVETGRTNHLFHLVDDRDLWTVLTARGPDRQWRHLAHMHWHLRYDFMLRWRDYSPQIFRNSSVLRRPDGFVLGAPADASLAPLLANPAPPHANALTRFAVTVAVNGVPPNRIDQRERFANVPPDFFVRTP